MSHRNSQSVSATFGQPLQQTLPAMKASHDTPCDPCSHMRPPFQTPEAVRPVANASKLTDKHPQGRKRAYSQFSTEENVNGFPPQTSPSPVQQYDPPRIKMPMPRHAAHTVGILRNQSPLIGQHRPSAHSSPFQRVPTPLARIANGPPPYSYGSAVSIDPFDLSPIPDPVAIAEIRRVIPFVPMHGSSRDLGAMLDALRADALSTRSTATTPGPAPRVEKQRRQPGSQPLVGLNIGIEDGAGAGAAFDALLKYLDKEELVDVTVATQDAA